MDDSRFLAKLIVGAMLGIMSLILVIYADPPAGLAFLFGMAFVRLGMWLDKAL